MRGSFSVRINRGLVCFVILALESQAALAHTQKGEAIGFLTGFKHPISGLDHVLAMVAVGLWGAQLGSPAIWLLRPGRSQEFLWLGKFISNVFICPDIR